MIALINIDSSNNQLFDPITLSDADLDQIRRDLNNGQLGYEDLFLLRAITNFPSDIQNLVQELDNSHVSLDTVDHDTEMFSVDPPDFQEAVRSIYGEWYIIFKLVDENEGERDNNDDNTPRNSTANFDLLDSILNAGRTH